MGIRERKGGCREGRRGERRLWLGRNSANRGRGKLEVSREVANGEKVEEGVREGNWLGEQ